MTEYRNVIVLQDARAVRDNLVQELAKWDFAVRSCGSLSGFRHLYALHPSPLIVLTGEPGDLARHTENVRAAAPLAIIVALCTATDPNWRVRIMASGADACHAASIEIIELAAILSSWGRHAARTDRVALAAQSVYGVPHGEAYARTAIRGDKGARGAFHGDSAEKPAESRPGRKGIGRRPSSGRASMAHFLHRQSTQSFDSCNTGYRGNSHHPVSSSYPVSSSHPVGSGKSGKPGNLGKSGNSDNAVDAGAISDPGGQPDCRPGRHSGRPVRLDSGWGLDVNCRVLICPRGRTLLLTVAENGFLMRIAASNGQLLRRHGAANAAAQTAATQTGANENAATEGTATESTATQSAAPRSGVAQNVALRNAPTTPPATRDKHGDTGDPDVRGMDVLVSRLRRKARRQGMELPLLAVRGCGYLFAEYLSVVPSRTVRSFAKSPSVRFLPPNVSGNRPITPPVSARGASATPSSYPSTSEVSGSSEVLATVPA